MAKTQNSSFVPATEVAGKFSGQLTNYFQVIPEQMSLG
jgi:hypothetical protein